MLVTVVATTYSAHPRCQTCLEFSFHFFLGYQVWNHLKILSETGRGKLLLWQWEHLLRPFRARLLPHWKCKDWWISMSWKKGSCKFFHAKIKGGVLRGSVMLQRGFLMPASPWWLWIGKTEQNRKCGEHWALSTRVSHKNIFLKKRNGSTYSVNIWGLLWRNPKGFLVLKCFRGRTTHFLFWPSLCRGAWKSEGWVKI